MGGKLWGFGGPPRYGGILGGNGGPPEMGGSLGTMDFKIGLYIEVNETTRQQKN